MVNHRLPQLERSHEEPFAVQFSVFLDNRVGQFMDVLNACTDKELTVYGVSVIDSTDWAVLRIMVSEPGKAEAMFAEKGLKYVESRVLLVVCEGEQSLCEVCELMLQAEINVHFAYPLIIRHDDSPIMVFHVDDRMLASQVLRRHGYVVLGDEDLNDPR